MSDFYVAKVIHFGKTKNVSILNETLHDEQ